MLNIMLFLGAFAVLADEPVPFWKSKEKVYERIREGEVIVAVKREKGLEGKGAHRLRTNGGGHVSAPLDFVFARALEFERLAEVSGYIHINKYDAAAQKLDLEIRAFGYKARMVVKLKIEDKATPKRIGFEIVDGSMRGMTGTFDFSEISARKTEVGIVSDYHYDKLNVPTFLIEFGYEVIFQRMAINLRSHVESEYKKMKGPE